MWAKVFWGLGLFSAPRRSRHIKQRCQFPVWLSSDYHRVSWASDIVSTLLRQLFHYRAVSQWTAMSGGGGGWAVIRGRLSTAVCSAGCMVDNNYHLILASHSQTLFDQITVFIISADQASWELCSLGNAFQDQSERQQQRHLPSLPAASWKASCYWETNGALKLCPI